MGNIIVFGTDSGCDDRQAGLPAAHGAAADRRDKHLAERAHQHAQISAEIQAQQLDLGSSDIRKTACLHTAGVAACIAHGAHQLHVVGLTVGDHARTHQADITAGVAALGDRISAAVCRRSSACNDMAAVIIF